MTFRTFLVLAPVHLSVLSLVTSKQNRIPSISVVVFFLGLKDFIFFNAVKLLSILQTAELLLILQNSFMPVHLSNAFPWLPFHSADIVLFRGIVISHESAFSTELCAS